MSQSDQNARMHNWISHQEDMDRFENSRYSERYQRGRFWKDAESRTKLRPRNKQAAVATMLRSPAAVDLSAPIGDEDLGDLVKEPVYLPLEEE